ncbi:MAG: outer membrane lipoprotein-sorting protein [Lentisphaerae bacterium]|nr:MAG: outer membrane lipoprotein-sorting protein [Lentisphaerota bacterium]
MTLKLRICLLSFTIAFPVFKLCSGEQESFIKNGELDLKRCVEHFEDLYRSRSSHSRATLTIIRKQRKRSLTLEMWSLRRDYSLIRILQPVRDRGTATLRIDKNIWNFFPRIHRTIRIPPSMMLSPWMGSHFTNDDLVRESSFLDDYKYTLLGRDNAGNWTIEFAAKPDLVGLWNRIVLSVTPDGRLPVRADYYDRKGRLARKIEWSNPRMVSGRLIPMRLVIIPADTPGEKTILEYQSITFDISLSESFFTISNLERRR